MTDCHQEPMLFSNLGRREVQADFTGGTLTRDAGALLLREADRRVGLIDAIDRVIPDPRDPERIHPTQRSMLAQRIISLALGYEDLNDQQALRHDLLLATAADRTPDLTPDATPDATPDTTQPLATAADAVSAREPGEPCGVDEDRWGVRRSVHRVVCRPAR